VDSMVALSTEKVGLREQIVNWLGGPTSLTL
jgi:hypothetical protein